MKINDKIIIITGASQGIGLETAKLLTKKGAKVVLAARSADALKEIESGLIGSFAIKTDMRKPDDIKKLVDETVKKYGRIDIVINNAGQGMYGPVEKIDLEKYQKIIELNVYGPLRMMQAVIPQMREQGGGMILNISSRVSKNYFPFLGAYASTKYALNAISLTARQELEKDKIIVSVMHPKMTATNFGKNAIGSRPNSGGANNTSNGASGSDANRPADRPRPEVDPPEAVAEKIAALIESEESEAEM